MFFIHFHFSDYGYYRHLESGKCLKDEKFKTSEFDICYMGHEEEIVTEGYGLCSLLTTLYGIMNARVTAHIFKL